MSTSKGETYTDYKAFYDDHEPDSAAEMLDLHTSVSESSDETFYKTEEVDRGKVRYVVTAGGDTLLLTEKSRDAFLRYIWAQHRHIEPELDIDERADLEYVLENPHS